MKKIVIAGYYGYGNLGDDLILKSLLSQLKLRWNNARLIVMSHEPDVTARNYGVQAIDRWNPLAILLSLWKSEHFILGGGGLLQDKTSIWSLLYYLSLFKVAGLLSKKASLYAIGVESIQSAWGRKFLTWALQGEKTRITVRDQESRNLLAQCGIEKNQIVITADPVFSLDDFDEGQQTTQPNQADALFIPRPPYGKPARAVFKTIFESFHRHHDGKMKGLLFQPRNEKKWMNLDEKAIEWMDTGTHHAGDIQKIREAFASVRWVVSARFHGLVLATLLGKPFLGVGTEEKVGRFCHLAGMPFIPWDAPPETIEFAIRQLTRLKMGPHPTVVRRFRESSRMTVSLL